MYDVDARIIRVEKSRNKYIGRWLRWELRKDLGFCGGLLCPVEERNTRRVFVAVLSRLVSLQLLVVLLFMLGEVVLDFR